MIGRGQDSARAPISRNFVLSIVVFVCYLASAVWLIASVRRNEAGSARGMHAAGIAMGVLALTIHGVKLWLDLKGSLTEWALSAGGTASLIAWVVAAIAVIAAARRARFAGASAMLLVLAGVVAALVDDSVRDFAITGRGWELAAHVVLSTVAYALLTVGAVLAIALMLLDKRLRGRRPLGGFAVLPPLDSLESGMFQAIAGGFALLTLALFSGFVFVEDFFAQHLIHKVVLSCLAWAVFGVLLAGRWYLGWRGRTALRWTLGGYVLLGLAYFGSKIVLEVILGRHWS